MDNESDRPALHGTLVSARHDAHRRHTSSGLRSLRTFGSVRIDDLKCISDDRPVESHLAMVLDLDGLARAESETDVRTFAGL